MRFLLSLILLFSVSAPAAEELAAAASTEPVPVVTTAAPVADTRTEAEIPLNLEANKKSASEGGSVFRILFTLSILGLVGAGAVVLLRKYSIPKAMKTQTQIKVLQQHYLGPKKSLAIVRVAGESILIGITDQNISMIKALSLLDDEIPEVEPQSFGGVLKDKSFDVDDAKTETRKSKTLDPDEEFAISGIKDIVSKRLKGMRSLQ